MAQITIGPGDVDIFVAPMVSLPFSMALLNNGVPRDLTGYTALATFTDAAGNILTLTNVSGITLVALAGTVYAVLSPAQIAAFSGGMATYGFWITDSNGVVTGLIAGIITLKPPCVC